MTVIKWETNFVVTNFFKDSNEYKSETQTNQKLTNRKIQ